VAVRDTDAVGHRTAARTTASNQALPPAGDGNQWRQWHCPLGIGAAPEPTAVVRSQAADDDVASEYVRGRADGTGVVRTGRRWRWRRNGRKSGEKESAAGFRQGRRKDFDVGRFVVGRRRRRSDVRCPTKRFAQVHRPRPCDGQRFDVVTLTDRRQCTRIRCFGTAVNLSSKDLKF